MLVLPLREVLVGIGNGDDDILDVEADDGALWDERSESPGTFIREGISVTVLSRVATGCFTVTTAQQ